MKTPDISKAVNSRKENVTGYTCAGRVHACIAHADNCNEYQRRICNYIVATRLECAYSSVAAVQLSRTEVKRYQNVISLALSVTEAARRRLHLTSKV